MRRQPSALDAISTTQLRSLREVLLPAAAAAAAAVAANSAAAAAAAAAEARGVVLVQIRGVTGDSVHGAGRTLTNLAELMAALRAAFQRGGAVDGDGGGSRGDGEADGSGREAEVLRFEHAGLPVAEQVAPHRLHPSCIPQA